MGLFALTAGFLSLMVSGKYLPSREWLRYSGPAFYWFLGVWAVLIFLFAARVSKHRDGNAYVDGAFVTILVCGLFFLPLSDFFHRSIPALVATVSGGDVRHAYKIIRADGKGDKWCRTPVELEDFPPTIKLCGMGEDFRSQLIPGKTMVFGGEGTWMGLRVEYVLAR
jgi:hypothetical protein